MASANRRRRRNVFGVPRWMVAATIGAFALGLAIAVVVSGGDGEDAVLPSQGGGQCTPDTEMDVYSEGDTVHTDHPSYAGPLGHPPRYKVDPPSGGDHLSQAVGPGVYQGDNVPPDGVLVHTLEHGYVILWHRPDVADEDLTDLEAVQRRYRRDALVVERPSLSVPVAATAWGHRLLCQSADPAELGEFVEARRNQAPEKIRH